MKISPKWCEEDLSRINRVREVAECVVGWRPIVYDTCDCKMYWHIRYLTGTLEEAPVEERIDLCVDKAVDQVLFRDDADYYIATLTL